MSWGTLCQESNSDLMNCTNIHYYPCLGKCRSKISGMYCIRWTLGRKVDGEDDGGV